MKSTSRRDKLFKLYFSKAGKELKYLLFKPPSSSGAYILRSFYIGLSLFKGFYIYTSLALLKAAIAAVSVLMLFVYNS